MISWYCPYWHKDKSDRVTCEAGTVRFPDKQAREEYIKQFCAGRERSWEQCSLAQMMETYYKEISDYEV